MILHHFSHEDFKLDTNWTYKKFTEIKPIGFWLSDESDHGWSKWCISEEFMLGKLGFKHSFKCDVTDWVVIRNFTELHYFHQNFKNGGVPDYEAKFHSRWIDWEKVKEQYKGILITPYDWKGRYEFMWYYGWDCASACVWDLSTIKQMQSEVFHVKQFTIQKP